MPQDSIMFLVDNTESLYLVKTDLYDKWIEEGEAWDEGRAKQEAFELAARFANALGARYGRHAIEEAAGEILEEFEEYREYAIMKAIEWAATPLQTEPPPMTPGDVRHAEKYEALSRKIGIDLLKELIPASPEQIQKAIQKGDRYLNSIKLKKWEAAAAGIPMKGLSLSEKVYALKHVATWHYA